MPTPKQTLQVNIAVGPYSREWSTNGLVWTADFAGNWRVRLEAPKKNAHLWRLTITAAGSWKKEDTSELAFSATDLSDAKHQALELVAVAVELVQQRILAQIKYLEREDG